MTLRPAAFEGEALGAFTRAPPIHSMNRRRTSNGKMFTKYA